MTPTLITNFSTRDICENIINIIPLALHTSATGRFAGNRAARFGPAQPPDRSHYRPYTPHPNPDYVLSPNRTKRPKSLTNLPADPISLNHRPGDNGEPPSENQSRIFLLRLDAPHPSPEAGGRAPYPLQLLPRSHAGGRQPDTIGFVSFVGCRTTTLNAHLRPRSCQFNPKNKKKVRLRRANTQYQ